jgi:hypothetical protein
VALDEQYDVLDRNLIVGDEMKLDRGIMLLMAIALLTACLFGCGSGSKELLWDTDRATGMFYTYDVERAQKEISFHIILPDYLPTDLGQYPYVEGTLKDAWPADRLQVRIVYQVPEPGNYAVIEIYEHNYEVIPPSSEENPQLFYIELGGIEVLVGPNDLPLAPYTDITLIHGWDFWWNREATYFEVGAYGYDWETTSKIVESMITANGV